MGACQAHAPNSDSTQGSPRIFETFRQVWLDSLLKNYEITDPPSQEHPPGCVMLAIVCLDELFGNPGLATAFCWAVVT